MSVLALPRPQQDQEEHPSPPSPHLLVQEHRVGEHDQKMFDQWGPRAEVSQCPNQVGQMVNDHSGKRLPARCRTRCCLFCNRVLARNIDAVVALAEPEEMLNFTGLTGQWQRDKKMFQQLKRSLSRDGMPIHLAWAIERNPNRTGFHAHGWAYADTGTVDAGQVYRRARDAGLGQTDARAVTYPGSFSYIIKNATWNQASLAEHGRLNGREVIHARGFWRDAETGTHLTLAKAITAAYNIDKDPSWRYEPAAPADRLGRRSDMAARARTERYALKDRAALASSGVKEVAA